MPRSETAAVLATVPASLPLGGTAPASQPCIDLLEAARRFLLCRERSQAYAPWREPHGAVSLAEAIDRDFSGFDEERAEAELRAAVLALCGGLMKVAATWTEEGADPAPGA